MTARERGKASDPGPPGRGTDKSGSELKRLRGEVRALEQTAGAFRALVENTSDPVYISDLDGRVRTWGPACEGLYGWPATEAVGSVLPHVPSQERGAEISAVRRAASGGTVVEDQVSRVTKDGARLTVLRSVVPLVDSDGLPAGVLVLARKVVADSRVETLQDEFVSLVSVELKNPLTAILGYSQLLRRPEIVDDPARRAQTVSALEARVQRMAALVEDLLVASRIDKGTLHLDREPTDLAGLVTETVTRFEQSQSSHRLVLGVDTRMALAEVDPRRIEQALADLLSNAVKFASDEGDVRVSLRREGEDAVIEVTDSGPGVTAEHAERVFERFYRADDSGVSGLGLGLYLVKMIAEAHGGSVSMDSEQGRGSTFSLRVPLRAPGSASPEGGDLGR